MLIRIDEIRNIMIIKWPELSLVAIYVLMCFWGLSSEQTWDDDCMTRYYQVKNAFNEPEQFVSTWNHPLFTAIFAVPLQFGRDAIVYVMALISVLTCFVLYKSIEKQENSWLIIPFVAFQTFFFSLSTNALAEPIAALIVACGFYCYMKEKWLFFAVIGSLLPLARLELSPLLGIWVIILISRKKFGFLPIFIVPLLIWNFAGTYFYGDWAWLWNVTIGGEHTANRYGHKEFLYYFKRYIFIVGPVVFYFMLFFLLNRIRLIYENFKPQIFLWPLRDLYIPVQFILGFLIYVVFSWKMNMGNSAGFLRHLVALSPLAGLMAWYGFNAWSMLGRKNLFITELLIVFIGAMVSKKLLFHFILTPIFWYVPISIIIGLTMLRLIPNKNLVMAVITTVLVGYTLITEPPDANNNGERVAMGQVSDFLYKEARDRKTYSNHVWFYWKNDLDYYKHGRMTMQEIAQAKRGEFLVWENHYSNRLDGDVPFDSLYLNTDKYELLLTVTTKDNKFGSAVFGVL